MVSDSREPPSGTDFVEDEFEELELLLFFIFS
jgi:hypothetical protein